MTDLPASDPKSEGVEPVFQKLPEEDEPEPSFLAKNAFPIVLVGSLALLAGVTSLDWRSWVHEPALPPTMSHSSTEVRALNDARVGLEMSIDVGNANDFGIQVLDYSLGLRVDGVQVVNTRVQRIQDFPGGSNGELEVLAEVPWKALGGRIEHYQGQGPIPATLPYVVELNARFAVPGTTLPIPLIYQGDLPLLVQPVMEPCALGVARTSATALRLEFEVCTTHPGGTPATLTDVRYELRVDDRTVLEEDLGETIALEARGTHTFDVVASMAQESAGRRLVGTTMGAAAEVEVRVLGSAQYDTGYGVVPIRFDGRKTISPRGL